MGRLRVRDGGCSTCTCQAAELLWCQRAPLASPVAVHGGSLEGKEDQSAVLSSTRQGSSLIPRISDYVWE